MLSLCKALLSDGQSLVLVENVLQIAGSVCSQGTQLRQAVDQVVSEVLERVRYGLVDAVWTFVPLLESGSSENCMKPFFLLYTRILIVSAFSFTKQKRTSRIQLKMLRRMIHQQQYLSKRKMKNRRKCLYSFCHCFHFDLLSSSEDDAVASEHALSCLSDVLSSITEYLDSG